MGRFDLTFKSLAESDPESLVRLFCGLPWDTPLKVTPLQREVAQSPLLVDHAYLVEDAEPWICHLEQETAPEMASFEVGAHHALALFVKHWMPVATTFVLASRARPAWNFPGTFEFGAMSVTSQFRPRVFRTWLAKATVILERNITAAMPWVAAFDSSVEQIQESRRRISAVTPALLRDGLMAESNIMVGLRYTDDEIARIFGGGPMLLSPYLASQSSVVKPLLEASREEGRHEGREVGRHEGWEVGRHEGQVEEGRRMVRLVLSSRFPDCGAFPELDSICDIASIEALVPFASTATLPEIVARIRGSVS